MTVDIRDNPIRDWRGTRILPGATVVFNFPQGRHPAAHYEAVVSSARTSRSGRIRVRVLRTSVPYDERFDKNLGILPGRLTVIRDPHPLVENGAFA